MTLIWRWHKRSWRAHCHKEGSSKTFCGLHTDQLDPVPLLNGLGRAIEPFVGEMWGCKHCYKKARNKLKLMVEDLLEDK